MTSGFAEYPAGHLFVAAADQARNAFAPPTPHVWAGPEGNRDLARMSRVAFLEIPALTVRFEADWEPFVERIHAIDGPTQRVVRGEAMLAATLGLRVVRGGMAA